MPSLRQTSHRASRSAPHKIRIIGGRYKRTPIPVLDLPGLRPTPDRVRETLFNWLTHLWEGEFGDKTVLDAFAGTGALGLEAASRGVAQAVLVEADRRAAGALEALRTRLGADNVRVVAGDVLGTLRREPGARFDLVMLDPPFGQGLLERVTPLVLQALTDKGILYIEAEGSIAPPDGTELLRQDRAGAVYFHLFRLLPRTT
ncbi:MAG: 16S rRNA (guanine(966)-N(2))-methyltransferase RsmD [Pigmentiphaga sp.]|uniref:16S rRNA (guanine(966)-N(2))-methyltransferase RsmD n=1 Tax=Pigmentiphaga sp. TaxID=1977564 RepID=UPI0029A815F6|nr:16S rRNA (guanine(966)-N(2))-methyltransferase RsmD [Pigmentiphaga sp.]MDX3907476.1 16S rRNA (guanine(966)-N(2))-methyltransferase RsmD [Pigmentiphaga sp.]